MKYLLLIALLLAVLWLLRQQRLGTKDRAARTASPPAATSSAAPTEIVACARCTVHLPRVDAVAGRQGDYFCCDEHRRQTEGA